MKRRMFDQSIVESDIFLDMPLSSQSLYFHLCMNADDYGFVSPKRIMRMLGATTDDLQILIAKRYILTFESGVVVIKHWHNNNTVRKDRAQMTTYTLEFNSLTSNEFGAYTERRKIKMPLIKKQQHKKLINQKVKNDNQMSPEIRLDKIRLDKTNNTNVLLADRPPDKRKPEINSMFECWRLNVGYDIEAKVQANRRACSNLLKKHGETKLTQLINGVALAHSDQYAPRISDFCDLQSKQNQLIAWGNSRKNTAGKVAKIR